MNVGSQHRRLGFSKFNSFNSKRKVKGKRDRKQKNKGFIVLLVRNNIDEQNKRGDKQTRWQCWKTSPFLLQNSLIHFHWDWELGQRVKGSKAHYQLEGL